MRCWMIAATALMLIAPVAAQSPMSASVPMPKDRDVLFWTQDQRDAAFRATETITKVNVIPAGGTAHPIAQGAPLKSQSIWTPIWRTNATPG